MGLKTDYINNPYNYNRYNYRYIRTFMKPGYPTNQYIGIGINIKSSISWFIILLILAFTTSCRSNYIYRLEYNNGSVDYFQTMPDTIGSSEHIKSLIRIKVDDIDKHETF